MNITLTPSFLASVDKFLKKYPKAYPDIFDFVSYLSKNPRDGDPVPGYGGLIFKIRWPLKSYKEGKSGGLRAYYFFNEQILAPFYLFTKKEMSDAPREVIQKLVTELLKEFPAAAKRISCCAVGRARTPRALE